MDKIIGILDYGMGNINSVYNSLSYIGYESRVITTVEEIELCSHLIIPGVGAYAQAMDNLRKKNIIDSINNHVAAGKPLLGICLGMQILSDTGEEGGEGVNGLGLIPGNVTMLDVKELPVPMLAGILWKSIKSIPFFIV